MFREYNHPYCSNRTYRQIAAVFLADTQNPMDTELSNCTCWQIADVFEEKQTKHDHLTCAAVCSNRNNPQIAAGRLVN